METLESRERLFGGFYFEILLAAGLRKFSLLIVA